MCADNVAQSDFLFELKLQECTGLFIRTIISGTVSKPTENSTTHAEIKHN